MKSHRFLTNIYFLRTANDVIPVSPRATLKLDLYTVFSSTVIWFILSPVPEIRQGKRFIYMLYISCFVRLLMVKVSDFFYMKSQITQTWLEILTLYSNSLSLRSEFQWSYPALPRTLPSTHFQVPSVFTAPIQTLFLNPEMNFCHEHVNKQSGPKLICCHAGKDIHVVLSWLVSYTTELCCYGLSSIYLKHSNISLFYFPSVYFLG